MLSSLPLEQSLVYDTHGSGGFVSRVTVVELREVEHNEGEYEGEEWSSSSRSGSPSLQWVYVKYVGQPRSTKAAAKASAAETAIRAMEALDGAGKNYEKSDEDHDEERQCAGQCVGVVESPAYVSSAVLDQWTCRVTCLHGHTLGLLSEFCFYAPTSRSVEFCLKTSVLEAEVGLQAREGVGSGFYAVHRITSKLEMLHIQCRSCGTHVGTKRFEEKPSAGEVIGGSDCGKEGSPISLLTFDMNKISFSELVVPSGCPSVGAVAESCGWKKQDQWLLVHRWRLLREVAVKRCLVGGEGQRRVRRGDDPLLLPDIHSRDVDLDLLLNTSPSSSSSTSSTSSSFSSSFSSSISSSSSSFSPSAVTHSATLGSAYPHIHVHAAPTRHRKTPRRVQLEALLHTVQKNMIVVIPTGCGKTLIAGLVMACFRRKNPRKLAVMVVDRIPLAHQQQQALVQDTGMSVCVMCGETFSESMLTAIHSGETDALVVTGDLLLTLLYAERLLVSECCVVVFDECHHAVKNHSFAKILYLIRDCAVQSQPRLLGLTASPTSAKIIEEVMIKLNDMKTKFVKAHIFHPSIPDDRPEIEKISVELSPRQDQCQRERVDGLRPVLRQCEIAFPGLSGGESLVDTCDNPRAWGAVRQLLVVSEKHAGKGTSLQDLALLGQHLLREMEVNYLLGPVFLEKDFMINDSSSPEVQSLFGIHSCPASSSTSSSSSSLSSGKVPDSAFWSVSPQLNLRNCSSQVVALCGQLRRRTCSSQMLVFVERKHSTHLLKKFLNVVFPEMPVEVLVGQTEMKWRGEEGQSAVLKRFREGETKLILCTSVLEEGLDVQGCDMVFRLGGLPSLIQVVQSRGRARDKNGQLCIIHTTDEQRHYHSIRRQHAILNEALSSSKLHPIDPNHWLFHDS